jgi:radical SAM protein with 4Fe4S-binding SPASM domain
MKQYDAERLWWLKNHVPRTREEYLDITAHANSLPVDFPRTVYLEVGAECNLDCSFCSKPSRRAFTREMSAEVLRRVVEECAANGVYALYCHLFNEPLLHTDKLLPVIRHAKDAGIPIVAVTTNVTPLTEPVMRALIEARLDTLHLSFEGANHRLYRAMRGAKAEVVEGRIERALEVRRQMDVRNARGQLVPWMAITLVRTQETDDEIAGFLARWKGVVDDVEIRPVLGFLGRTALGKAVKPERRIPCRYVGDRLIVAADGTVTACSVDVDAALDLGNVIDGATLREVWHGARYRDLWALHAWQRWDELPEPCRSCDSWDFTATARSQHLQETIR